MERIREIFESSGPFLLATHVNPDADGLSCVLAAHLFFKARGVESYPLVEDDPPHFLQFLHGFEDLIKVEDLPRRPEECLALVFDLSEAQRLGDLAETVLSARQRVILDHHAVSGEPLSGLRLVDPRAPATAFLLYQILRDLGEFSPEVAENLYVGLYSDTGGFRFENTREEAFLAAAELVRAGARPGEAEDLATFLRSMRGVEVSALVKEIRPGEIGVSLRSRGSVDVARLAASQGGGGHVRAAGFRKREIPLQEVLPLVRNLLLSVLEVGHET